MKIVYRQKPNDAQTLYGLSINGDTLELTYPVCLTFSNDLVAKRKELYAYMASIEIGKKIEERINGSFRDGYPLAVEAARYIIDDYLKKGFYINRENTVQKNASGMINWKKTFQKIRLSFERKTSFFTEFTLTLLSAETMTLSVFTVIVSKRALILLDGYGICHQLELNATHSPKVARRSIYRFFKGNWKQPFWTGSVFLSST